MARTVCGGLRRLRSLEPSRAPWFYTAHGEGARRQGHYPFECHHYGFPKENQVFPVISRYLTLPPFWDPLVTPLRRRYQGSGWEGPFQFARTAEHYRGISPLITANFFRLILVF